jgi:hypothetical protein
MSTELRKFKAIPSVSKGIKTFPSEHLISRPRNSTPNGWIKEHREILGRGETLYLGNGKGLDRDNLKPELPDIKGTYVQGEVGSVLVGEIYVCASNSTRIPRGKTSKTYIPTFGGIKSDSLNA